jgi:hypothetical protein
MNISRAAKLMYSRVGRAMMSLTTLTSRLAARFGQLIDGSPRSAAFLLPFARHDHAVPL